MTRQDIERQYKVDEFGIIRSPGKFEREGVYAPFFYDIILNGGGTEEWDENEDLTTYIDVTDQDRIMFPELKTVERVACSEDGSGFFYCRLI